MGPWLAGWQPPGGKFQVSGSGFHVELRPVNRRTPNFKPESLNLELAEATLIYLDLP
jgi:hypothetical protein